MLDMAPGYRCLAPDMRGFGETEALPINAALGLRDLSDDLLSLLNALHIDSAHLLGWSAGAGAVMQFAIDHQERAKSLTLVAPVSPYGFGGTCDIHGTRSTEDFAGTGGGTVNAVVVEQFQLADPGSDSPAAARQMLRTLYAKAPFRFAREDAFVEALYRSRLGEKHYPGDFVESSHWPHIGPGKWGLINGLSPKYCDLTAIAELPHKPPILWVRGNEDAIVSDNSLLDFLAHRDDSDLPPQPMIGQTRQVLAQYTENGGSVEELEIEGCGHTPFLENPGVFMAGFSRFLQG